jgi:hypothetical protein
VHRAVRIKTHITLSDMACCTISDHTPGYVVNFFKAVLFQNTGCQAGAMPGIADEVNCFVLMQFLVAGTQCSASCCLRLIRVSIYFASDK